MLYNMLKNSLVYNDFLEKKNYLIICILSQVSIFIVIIYLVVSFHESNLAHCLIEKNFYLQIQNLNKKILEMQSEKTSFLQQATAAPVVKTYYEWFTENSHIVVPVFIGIVCIGCIGIYFYYGKGNPPFPPGDDGGTGSSGGSISTSENVSTSAVQSTLKGSVEKIDLSIAEDFISSNIGIEENIIKAAGGGTCDPVPIYVTSVVNKITIKNIQGFEGSTGCNIGPDLFTCITHDTININDTFDSILWMLSANAEELDRWNADYANITQVIFTKIKDGYTQNIYGVYTHMTTGFQPPWSFYKTDWVPTLAKAISVTYLGEPAADGIGPANISSIPLALSEQIEVLNQIQLAGQYSAQINGVILLLKDLLALGTS